MAKTCPKCKPSKLPNVGCAIFRTDRSGALWCEHNIDHSEIPADYVRLEEHNRQLAQIQTDWKAWHRQISDALGCKFLERRVTLKAAQKLSAELAQAKAVIHAAYCDGWLEREEYEAVDTHLGKAVMDADWRNSATREAAEAAKKEPATDGKPSKPI